MTKSKMKLAKLEPQNRDRILDFFENTLPNLNNPSQLGQALQGNLQGYWRYRVGDYRILCEIIDNQMIIYAI
jgi:mRNA interferase RelE/StbE